MGDDAWNDPHVKCLGVRLAGDLMNETDERGEPIVGDTLLLLLNAHWEEIGFTLPTTSHDHLWESLVDTRDHEGPVRVCRGGERYPLFGRSLAMLRATPAAAVGASATPEQVAALRKEIRRLRVPSA